jgi:predicted ATP-grasp superfamily ATP-dependent carboligase
MSYSTRLPPAIVIGGIANALSVARSLSRQGIKVYAINDEPTIVGYSRHCRLIRLPVEADLEAVWTRFLLSSDSDFLRGAVLLACCDEGIHLMAEHRQALLKKYRLDDSDPKAQLCMLNKLSTYRQAVAAGVPTPRFWLTSSRPQILALREELVFPLLVKPLLSHQFGDLFIGEKFFVANDMEGLLDAFSRVSKAEVETMLVEQIPGPDSLLCSYYTYLDAHGTPLFDFTKRVIRRFPVGMGNGTYHVTDWNPEVKEAALKLFDFVGLRGLANVEFKRDPRDGRLKLIECNARFTAANSLVAESGYDLASFVYNRVVGRPQPPFGKYATGKRLWYPYADWKAYRELNRRGELTFRQWVKSIMHPFVLPYFRWDDPFPSLLAVVQKAKLDHPVEFAKRVFQKGWQILNKREEKEEKVSGPFSS